MNYHNIYTYLFLVLPTTIKSKVQAIDFRVKIEAGFMLLRKSSFLYL